MSLGYTMKIIFIRRKRPGLYRRHYVIYEGKWVSIIGIALLPALRRRRKWAGFAFTLPIKPPNPLPKEYKYHTDKRNEPYSISHYPEGKEK